MIVSWIDLAGAAVLWLLGVYFLRRGQGRALGRRGKGWGGDIGALLTAVLGGGLVAMGLGLLFYSASLAVLSEKLLRR